MRKQLQKYLPDGDTIRQNRWLRPFGNTLLHPRLWHLNRHSAAGAVAVGLFCGLIPGPFQMLGSALCALLWRVNLPLAMIVTLYSNPLTIGPLYLVAFWLGKLALTLVGQNGAAQFAPMPELQGGDWLGWFAALTDWVIGLWLPLALGLPLLGGLLAVAGYVFMRFAWRYYLIRAWRRRRTLRKGHDPA
ncbi:MAG TPA: DUF2062 domain-containing protein [Rhodocyclaceae bacterium]|nr:DUF2062 domain-containing protein [Rhodocyclaceae bacterium]